MHRLASLFGAVALLFAVGPSRASVNKCVDSTGKTVYQDTPCSSDSQSEDVPRHITADRGSQKTIDIDVGAAGRFSIKLPSTWQTRVRVPDGIQAPTLEARSRDGGGTSLAMTFLPVPQQVDKPEELLANVMTTIAGEHENEPESRRSQLYPFTTPNLPGGLGAHLTFKDESLANLNQLPNGEYVYMSAGAIVAGQVLINFTLLTNDLQSSAYRTALTNVVKLSKSVH